MKLKFIIEIPIPIPVQDPNLYTILREALRTNYLYKKR